MSWLRVICSGVVLRRQDLKITAIERRKRGYNYYPKHATPLYYAASFGIEHVVKALLEQGAEVDATGGRLGATAFHAAALRGHVKVMDILFHNGADPNNLDFVKKTPLNSAALRGNVEVIKYLLEHGADPDIMDDCNKTAYDWACMLGHEEARNVLEPVTVGESSDSPDGDRAKRSKPLFTRNTASTAWVTTGAALLPGQSESSSLQGTKPGIVEVTKTWSSSAHRDSDVL
jgi:ankyrin repeat protein